MATSYLLRARYHELRRAAYGTSMPVTVELEHVGGAFEKERAQMLEASATEPCSQFVARLRTTGGRLGASDLISMAPSTGPLGTGRIP
jgi:hypothetical protein